MELDEFSQQNALCCKTTADSLETIAICAKLSFQFILHIDVGIHEDAFMRSC